MRRTDPTAARDNPLQFRDRERARQLRAALERVVADTGPIKVMHVCGTHEQCIARYGLRSVLPRELDIIMGPGCPVCVTTIHEVDEGVALALDGKTVLTYGDMLRVPGTRRSLHDARSEGARVDVIYSPAQAVDHAREHPDEQVVLYATGFETTAVATAAVVLGGPPANFSVLSAHKYVPPAMELVASLPDSRIQGFLAAGHAAAITGWRLFDEFSRRTGLPVVVGGFEPLDILAGLLDLAELIRDEQSVVHNAYPRVVSPAGNGPALEALWRVFEPVTRTWRGIGPVPDGNLDLRDEWAHLDARQRFTIDTAALEAEGQPKAVALCRCGDVMVGRCEPTDCKLFGTGCVPDRPVGACMVSTEGTCRIWYQYGGHPDLGGVA